MFSKLDASQLLEQLESIEFLRADTEPQQSLSAEAQRQFADYTRYYGLNFSELDPKLAGVRTSIGTFPSGSYQLVCQHFLPPSQAPRMTAFLLHGYFDHAGLYRHLIKHLLERNIAVVMFDLPGHGLSSGAVASISSFQEYVDALVNCLSRAREQQVTAPWVGIGQSTGGAIFMDGLIENKLQTGQFEELSLQKFILLGPLLRPKYWSRSKILFSLSRFFLASTPRKFSKNSHDPEFLEFLESEDELQSRILPRDWVQAMIHYINRFEKAPQQQQPLQIIQGRGDGTVEWETNIPKILAKFTGSSVNWVDDAGHHLVNESAHYREQVFDYIDAILE
ncbi:MAG: hypothetical protein DHS20C12_05740 [Pseudohongiella sp.]|nr:MAG: hypothetical protein DHS20C12_05740 [Pseudohongiella sp.]